MTNNKNLFIDNIQLKCLNFTLDRDRILSIKCIKTITILFVNEFSIEFYNIVYTLDFNLNLILLDKLYDRDIKYINDNKVMTLIKPGLIIT